MKKLLFIVNPSAGRTTIKNKLFEIIEMFSDYDYETVIRPTKKEHDARDIAFQECSKYDLIVCAGGDGTLDETVTGLMMANSQTPLGYIPCGTTNDFAKSLGIPKDPVRAARRAVRYEPHAIDIGSMITTGEAGQKQDYFVYIATFGAFTEVAYSTPQDMKNIMGHTAYMVEALKSIMSLKSYAVTVTTDNETITGNYIYAMVCNSNSVAGFRPIAAKNVEFDDGLFEVVLITYPKTPLELQSIITSILMNEENTEFIKSFKTNKVTFHSEEAIPWDIDGEYGGDHTDVTIEVHDKAIEFVRKL